MSAPKFRDGKPLFKSGKPAFCCCGSGCCEYPAAGIIAEDFTWEDLPESLLSPGSGVGPFTRVEPYEWSGITIYYDAPDVAEEKQYIGIELAGAEWVYGSVLATSSACLVVEGLVEDEFADTLYADIAALGVTGQAILRAAPPYTDFCSWYGAWTGPEDQAYELLVQYIAAEFKFFFQILQDGFQIFSGFKDDPQSSPVGDYPDAGMEIYE